MSAQPPREPNPPSGPSGPEDPEAVLARWIAEEEAIRPRYEEGFAAAAAGKTPSLSEFADKPGIAIFEAMMAGRMPGAPIARTLDFLPVLIEPGHAVFQGQPKLSHYNPIGSVHGGWFATLLDSALGCAVHSALPPGKAYTTLELKVNMIRALTTKVPRVRVDGRLIHLGGQTATADARMIGPDGRLYAHATTTCLVFPARR